MCLRPLLSANWLKWPDHDGAQGAITETTLAPGTLIDRFGSDFGVYFSPKGIPYAQRALPYACDLRAYRIFRVEKSMPVGSATIAPWFDEPGLGIQYKAKESVAELLKDGTITVVPVGPGDSPC